MGVSTTRAGALFGALLAATLAAAGGTAMADTGTSSSGVTYNATTTTVDAYA